MKPKETYPVKFPRIAEAKEIVSKIRKSTYGIDVNAQMQILDEDMKGVREIMDCLNDIMMKASPALQMGAFTMATLSNQHPIPECLPDIYARIKDTNPAATMSEAGMAVSQLNHNLLARIRVALYKSHELFNSKTLDLSIEELLEDYE